MKKVLTFLDIDGTLIQPNQRPNTKKLPSIIQKLAKLGVLFGLNSNRSLEDIVPIYSQFGLNGPVILENGVYFLKSLNARKIFLIKRPPLLNKMSVEAIKAFIKENRLSCQFSSTNTVKAIRSKKLKKIPLGIFLNKFRKYTGSVHIFRYGKRDIRLANELCIFLKKYFLKKQLGLSVESTKSFGNVIFWPRYVNKTKALNKIRKFYPEYLLFMIGDDLIDSETRQEAEGFFTVANALSEVKEEADYVSNKAYTKGVVDILNYIEQRFFNTKSKL